MSAIKFNPRTLILLLFIFVVASLRVLAPMSPEFYKMANFTVIGAIALFGGAYFKNQLSAFGFPIVTLLLSDVILGVTVYKSDGFLYQGWYWTYLAFALMVVAGKVILKKVNAANFVVATAVTVLIHWIVTDLGVWYGSSLYPQTIGGFWACLVAAIPFERSFLYGTAMYGAIMFGSFEYLKVKYPALNFKKKIVA